MLNTRNYSKVGIIGVPFEKGQVNFIYNILLNIFGVSTFLNFYSVKKVLLLVLK